MHSLGIDIAYAEQMPMQFALAFLQEKLEVKRVLGRQNNTPSTTKESKPEHSGSVKKVSTKRVCQ